MTGAVEEETATVTAVVSGTGIGIEIEIRTENETETEADRQADAIVVGAEAAKKAGGTGTVEGHLARALFPEIGVQDLARLETAHRGTVTGTETADAGETLAEVVIAMTVTVARGVEEGIAATAAGAKAAKMTKRRLANSWPMSSSSSKRRTGMALAMSATARMAVKRKTDAVNAALSVRRPTIEAWTDRTQLTIRAAMKIPNPPQRPLLPSSISRQKRKRKQPQAKWLGKRLVSLWRKAVEQLNRTSESLKREDN